MIHIRLSSGKSVDFQDIAKTIHETFSEHNLSNIFKISKFQSDKAQVHRGLGLSPAEISAIILTAVSFCGTLSAVLGKEVFFTRLAKVFETYINKKVDITLETRKGKVHLSGSASHIELILRDRLQN